jgi:chromosome segregation ATPase
LIKKILPFVILYSFSSSSFSENNEVLMRMYERLEMIRLQMQQLTEENQQLNNKISILQNQQDRLYQDLANKIQELQENLKKNSQSSLSISRDKINKIEDISSIENTEKQVENKKKVKRHHPA